MAPENGPDPELDLEITEGCIHEIKKTFPHPIVFSDQHLARLRVFRRAANNSIDALFQANPWDAIQSMRIAKTNVMLRTAIKLLEMLVLGSVQFKKMTKPEFAALITWEDIWVGFKLMDEVDIIDDRLILPIMISHMAKRHRTKDFSLIQPKK